jgi:caa(3)-type oxidase subunit IV
MTDEQTPPVEGEPTPVDPQNPPEPIKEMKAKTIREIRAETVSPAEMPEPAKGLHEAETLAGERERRQVEKALDAPINAIEDAAATLDRQTTPHTPADVMPHIVPDTTDFFGKFTIPLPVYDVVFIFLFIFTVIEVLIGTLLGHGWLLIVVLLALAFVKAFHVVWFYMHLGTDNRIFWATLMIPFFIATVGLLYLLAVPPRGY